MGHKLLILGALVLGSAAAAAPATKKAAPAADAPSAEVKQLLENCDAHKFETTVDSIVDGRPHKSRVKMCGKEGQSDADWIGTLKDAITKLDANKDMDPSVRDQIVKAVNAEIARLQMMADLGPPKARQPVSSAASGLSRDYSSLPPLPTAPPPPPKVLGSVAAGPVKPSSNGVGTPVAASSVAVLPSGPAPKLSFACYSPGDIGDDAPCAAFDRETTLTIRAQADVPAGVALRFVRNGEQRAEVALAQLRRGKSLRIALPTAVCAGVGDGSLRLQVVQNGAEVRSDGPYSLRC